MKKRLLAIAKDDILTALNNVGSMLSIENLLETLDNKKYNYNEIKDLLEEINNSDYSHVITVFRAEPFGINQASSSSFTQEFLKSGGFTSLYDEEQSKTLLEVTRTDNKAELVGKSNKYYWAPHLISALSAVIALISLFYSMKVRDVEFQVSKEEFNSKIQQLEYNQKQLELQYREENQKLQDQLDKANEWIEILEDDDPPKELKKASV